VVTRDGHRGHLLHEGVKGLLLSGLIPIASPPASFKLSPCASQMLRTLLNSASAGTLLLLEDIDAAFTKQRAAAAAGKESQLSFSGTPALSWTPDHPHSQSPLELRGHVKCPQPGCTFLLLPFPFQGALPLRAMLLTCLCLVPMC